MDSFFIVEVDVFSLWQELISGHSRGKNFLLTTMEVVYKGRASPQWLGFGFVYAKLKGVLW